MYWLFRLLYTPRSVVAPSLSSLSVVLTAGSTWIWYTVGGQYFSWQFATDVFARLAGRWAVQARLVQEHPADHCQSE